MRIYKYTLEVTEEQFVKIPFGFEVLSIQNQNDDITFWAAIDPENEPRKHKFKIFGTGQDIDFEYGTWKYLGTVQIGYYVWHVYCDPNQWYSDVDF